MGRLRALYRAQFWRIFANNSICGPKFTSTGIGRFYGRFVSPSPWASANPGNFIDPPRGRPFGGGGAHRSWGCGGRQPPRYHLHAIRIIRPKVFQKSPGHKPPIPGNDRSRSGTFWKKSGHFAEQFKKSSVRLSKFCKKVRQHYRTFLKLSGNVIDLSGKCLMELSTFYKKIRQGS